jgi:hypothetical protein
VEEAVVEGLVLALRVCVEEAVADLEVDAEDVAVLEEVVVLVAMPLAVELFVPRGV